jgi:lysophospholipase
MNVPALASLPQDPVPEGAQLVPLTTADGVLLRAARFPAQRGIAFKGTVCLFQGRGEFIEKYIETICDLTARGFDVATLDWRGQGGSQRGLRSARRGHIRHFDDFQRDLDVFMENFVRPDCRPPFFALAHSMGGAIVLEGARRRTTWWDRVVLSAPMVGLPGMGGATATQRIAATCAALGLGRLFIPGGSGRGSYAGAFERNVLTGDAGRYARVRALEREAPHLLIGSPTIGWLKAAHGAMALFQDPERISQIRTPTLFVAAGADRVVSNRATAVLASQMRTAKVVTLPDARHEILMERDAIRGAFLSAFNAFVPGSPAFPD